MTKAIVAKIDLGFVQFDGLMLPDGSYAIGVSQIAELIGFSNEHSSRDIKALLGKDFQFAKVSSELNNKAVNTLTIKEFSLLLIELTAAGYPVARALASVFAEEAIDRRYDTAFGKKVSESERNQILAQRMKRLLARRAWTDLLQDRHIQCYGTKPTPKQFKDWTVRVNQVLFSRNHFNCDRDNMQSEEQRTIEMFENMAIRRAGQNPQANPAALLELALDTF